MARTCRGIRTRRHSARTSMNAGTAMANHTGGQRHQPSRTNARGRLRTATVIRFPTAHSTRRTVTYLGETRSHATPGGSIAAVGIFAFPLGLAWARPAREPVPGLGVAVLRRNLAKAFDD